MTHASQDYDRIPPEHAQAFRGYMLKQAAPRTRLGMAVAAAVFGMATLGDIRSMPAEVLAWSAPVRIGVVVPALLLLAWIASDERRLKWHLPVAFIGCAITGLTIAGIVIHLQLLGHGWTIHRAVLLSFGVYVLSGLRIQYSTAIGALLALSLGASELVLGEAAPKVVRGLISLVGANLLGFAAAREIERSMRTSFLSQLRLSEQAQRDPLTGLRNRRHLDEHLARVHRLATRGELSIAVAMIDVDEFKRFNDALGHVAGDACLRDVAGALEHCAQRPVDLVARYGGEEFLVVWYDVDPESLEGLAERCRDAVASLRIPHPDSRVDTHVTVSVGAVAAPANRCSPETLVERADAALYEAKQRGRDTVVARRLDED
ncbi:MAG: GGDEF domain-containing protein [bacterium]|nr:GGDEF domain-containing protein [bacterium]